MSLKIMETAMHVFFIRYRKLISTLCIITLLFLPFKIYEAPSFSPDHKFEFIGYWLDTSIYVAIPIWMLVKIRTAVKAYRDEDKWKEM
ncbi:hypothetical protein GCM10022392_23390 [Mucilaginibacter panaciglaebae]|uniref:Uncharacterized protein n=1 Tax=Mucilaginibacter panaciglaebae TaxID=502331 RepID=A0ABP7WWU3_9SPHI